MQTSHRAQSQSIDKIEDFLSFAEANIKRGILATVEKMETRVYRSGNTDGQAEAAVAGAKIAGGSGLSQTYDGQELNRQVRKDREEKQINLGALSVLRGSIFTRSQRHADFEKTIVGG
jgi:DNA invertase Pin-like site-specific DNA recombinase